MKPDLAPDDPGFWTQDHLEFRFLPHPAAYLDQAQFILALDGRCFDSLGLWKQGDIATTATKITGNRFEVSLRIPFTNFN